MNLKRVVFLFTMAGIVGCASAERHGIARLFDRSRILAFLKEAEQRAVVRHDYHPALVVLFDATGNPPSFRKPVMGTNEFVRDYLPEFNKTIRPLIKDAHIIVEEVTVRGTAAFVSATTIVEIDMPGKGRRNIRHRGHYFLVKVRGKTKPRWVMLVDAPESAEARPAKKE